MGYRNIVVEGDYRITLRNKQLILRGEREYSVPLEDINAILFESRQCTISTALLSALVDNAVTVYFCDEKHIPNGVMFPYAQFSRQLHIIKLQDKMTLPGKKRLWQQIIQAKIANQGLCARYLGLDNEADYLRELSKEVLSGDNAHLEAVAAAYYFPRIFGEGFSRNDGLDGRNGALNYGYAIMRGNIARLIAVYGFFPSYGIYHRSELNAFNLADDIMEPFRPVVDLYVATHYAEDEYLTLQGKRELFNLLNVEIESGGEKHSVAYAAERLVQSMTRCYEDYQRYKLMTPRLLPLKQHRYE